MSPVNIKNVYPTKEEIRAMRDSFPNGFGKIIQEKLKANGEDRPLKYIYNVMSGHHKNVNVMAAVIEYRNELKQKLQIEPEQ